MKDYIENKINTIKNKQLFGIIIENGAGTPVYTTLCKYPNTASKHVNYIISSNNINYNKQQYNYKDDIHDPQNVLNILNKYNVNKNEYILVNSIQILDDITKGWFALSCNNKVQLYHFTINNKLTRDEILIRCAQIGLDILASTNNYNELDNGYIDNILNEDLTVNKIALLTALKNAKLIQHYSYNTMIVFNKNNEIKYINDILFQNNKLILIKSNDIIKSKDINNTYFCISLKNNINEIQNILNKINELNRIGYNVIIEYFDNIHYSYTTLLNNKEYNKHDIVYLMNDEEFQDLLKDELVITEENEFYNEFYKKFNIKWSKCKFNIKQNTNFIINNKINNITIYE